MPWLMASGIGFDLPCAGGVYLRRLVLNFGAHLSCPKTLARPTGHWMFRERREAVVVVTVANDELSLFTQEMVARMGHGYRG